MTRAASAPPAETVRPLPLPTGLALLRGVFTVSGWAATTLPALFALLLLALGVESLTVLFGATAFSETTLGDAVLSAVIGAAAVITGCALAVNLASWLMVAAVELRIAESVASRERLSAQDARRLSTTASERAATLLGFLAVVLLLLGALVSIILIVEDDPEFGGWRAGPLPMLPGIVLAATVVPWLRAKGRAAQARRDELQKRWPAVDSRPEPIHTVRARLRAQSGDQEPADDSVPRPRNTHRRESAWSSPALVSPVLVVICTFWIGFGITVLSELLRLEDLGTSIALVVWGLGAVSAAALATARRVRDRSSAHGAERAGVAVYARRHPSVLTAAVIAGVGGVVSAAALSTRWLPEAASNSLPDETGLLLGGVGTVLLLVAVVLSAAEHRATRDWRAAYLRAHPDQDPWWEPDLHHDGLQEIRGWFVG